MTRAWTLLAGLSAIAFAAPAAAQSAHGDHPPPKPVADAGCTPEHAAMGHCILEGPGTTTNAHGEPMPTPAEGDPGCTPEHAAMGHCTLKAATPPVAAAVGTDLPAGDAPAPPPPSDWYADRIYPKAEMDHARHAMMIENGGQTIGFASLDLEYQARKGRDGFSWDGEAWYGGDINRLTIKSEGEGAFGEGLEDTETQLLYSRAIGPYFNAQAGVRQDFGPGADRSYMTIGFEGLAPYWFEVEGALFLSDKGDLLGRFEGEYDQRITQKLVLQPAAGFGFAVQDIPQQGVGSGLSDVELGLRLRYEIVKEFAPYIGVTWHRKLSDTARFARAAGESAESTNFVIGVRSWF